ncbi:hypothetical protein ANCCEY_00037 [Ancylostoma ceylanicum]|uniref:Uncharacterized protein n=1 Tax=Ancylostoma ceylanicum TaxID=53326 RepID=A0A0D6M9R0_9BILA|nr:hypothetical protein ANCCEY_00037 [Ancylostoma ceylanicum]
MIKAKAKVHGKGMRTFWGRKGKPITLPCTLPPPDDTNFSLEWRKDNKLIMSAYGDEAGHAAPSLQVPYIISINKTTTNHNNEP